MLQVEKRSLSNPVGSLPHIVPFIHGFQDVRVGELCYYFRGCVSMLDPRAGKSDNQVIIMGTKNCCALTGTILMISTNVYSTNLKIINGCIYPTNGARMHFGIRMFISIKSSTSKFALHYASKIGNRILQHSEYCNKFSKSLKCT